MTTEEQPKPSTFPMWPIMLVGGVAIAIFVGTLLINPKK
jgi:hypothetical protein